MWGSSFFTAVAVEIIRTVGKRILRRRMMPSLISLLIVVLEMWLQPSTQITAVNQKLLTEYYFSPLFVTFAPKKVIKSVPGTAVTKK